MLLLVYFKQKTAYEVLISDWSSDVCSSDLPHVAKKGAHRFVDAGELCRREFPGHVLHQPGDPLKADDLVPLGVKVADFVGVEGGVHDAVLDEQIGRASCRERVCQSV